MDSWVVGQVAFWYTVHEIDPSSIVDRVIQLWVDLITPGRGVSSNGPWGFVRRIQETSERTSSELDIRRSLREWDSDHPEIHHEILVRWVVGALISVAVTSFYNSFRRSAGRPRPRW